MIYYLFTLLFFNANWDTKLQLGSIVSALLGTVVGGFITAFITKRNLQTQFDNQTERELIKEKKEEKIALNSILREIKWNKDQLFRSQTILDTYHTNKHEIKDPNEKHGLKNDKWLKHSDTVQILEDTGFLENVETFYHNITNEINNNNTLLRSRIVDSQEHARECIKELSDYIDRHYS